jgi:hypothetical protein
MSYHWAIPSFRKLLFEATSATQPLSNLGDYLPGMPRDIRADLDQFLPQRRQRPVAHRPGRHRLPHEIARVLGQHDQLQPRLDVHKVVTGQARPFDGVLALLDPLLGCASLL